MMKKININDIAKITGFSTTTVSRVLNGKAEQYRIAKKTQKEIESAAKKMNYTPNLFATNLRTGKSNTISLIIPSLNNPFFASISSEINSEIRKYGYTTIISDSDENPEIEKMDLEQLRARNIEGLIIVPCSNQWKYIKDLYDQNMPIVCIDRYFENLDIPYVSTDNYYGAFHATQLLIKYGHNNIACIQGVQDATPNRLRVKGFTEAIIEAGIKNKCIVGNDFSIQNGYLETKLLLQQKKTPTAIFALSNTIAMGCIRALKEENKSIPDDISLITFDDHPYLDYLETPLSCVAQPISDISKIAVKFLFSIIDKRDVNVSQVLLKPVIKLKESVKKLI